MIHDHDGLLEKVRQGLPADELLMDLADLFKMFGDSTRVKILFLLFESELCVCAIAELLCMEQSAISHQLKKLKEASLVKSRRQGKTVFYSLADDHVYELVRLAFAHLIEKRGRVI